MRNIAIYSNISLSTILRGTSSRSASPVEKNTGVPQAIETEHTRNNAQGISDALQR